jgi:pentalenene oxygenase
MSTATNTVSPPVRLGTAPGRLPVVSHALEMLLRPLEFLEAMRHAGDVVKVRLGAEWAYFVRPPELLRQILLTDHCVFDKGGPFFERSRTIAGNGILTCPAKDHGRQRRLMQPLFGQARLSAYADVMTCEAARAAAAWRDGQSIEVGKAMSALTLAITTRTLFSTEAERGTVAEVQDDLVTIFEGLYLRMIVPVDALHKLPTAGNRRFDRAAARLPVIVDRIIEERRRAGRDEGDLLAALLGARDPETGEGLSDVELREQVMALLVAGTETTAAALTSTFHLLDRHRDVERRLQGEVDQVLGGRPARLDDLPGLDFTRRTFLEALRLYPPGWILTRRTTADVELGGHRLPAGTTVLFSPYALQRDPELFPEPERFDPDRFLPEREKAIARFAMLPFSAGKRKCMGDAFAMNMAQIVLGTLAGRFQLRATPGSEVHASPGMTLAAETRPMRVESRPAAAPRDKISPKGEAFIQEDSTQ